MTATAIDAESIHAIKHNLQNKIVITDTEIEQNRRCSKRHDRNGRKVTDREAQNASESKPKEERKIAKRNPESGAIFDQEQQTEDYRGNRDTDGHDLDRIEAERAKPSDKDSHAAPEAAGQDDQHRADIAFTLIHDLFFTL